MNLSDVSLSLIHIWIAEAEEIRHASDYDDFYIATKEETGEQVEVAEELIKLVEEYCEKRIKE